jgi:two-component system NtrC family sensor kinase
LKFPVYSLRTGILAQLTFLIIAAMLLINVVMVKFAERDLTQERLHTGQLLIRAVEQNLGLLLIGKTRKVTEAELDFDFRKGVSRMLGDSGFSDMLIINQEGNKIFTTDYSSEPEEQGLVSAREALATGLWSHQFSGTAWSVIWLSKSDMRISAPLSLEGRPFGAITVDGSLLPLYETLRSSQTVILFYILMDTVILVLVGYVLLSRIVVKPIDKLLTMTGAYKDGFMVPTLPESSKNEIGDLTRSLSHMMRRLDENKRELQSHISSLEKANRDLRQAQDEIIRSEKLASVGRLAAGIAHEIGNPIGIILGYLDLLNSGDISEAEKKDFLNRIESEIVRVNRIIRQLLDFSRPSSGEPVQTRVHDLVKMTLAMLEPQPMMEGIRTTLKLKAQRDSVLADPNQLQQVFLNIIMNAADALAESQREGATKELTVRSERIEKTIELRISDNGPGISEAELLRIFDPFYTTKEPGKGTGLGLSVCYRIVEGLGGKIRAESKAGEGTTIIVSLPLHDGKDKIGEG